MKDVVIVGGGTAGLTAAIYLRRAGKTALILEAESFGGQITYSPRVENYPGIPAISGNEFADRLVGQALDLGAEVELERVTGLLKEGDSWEVLTESGKHEAKAVILATGVKHRKLGIDGEERLSGNGVSYCAVCDGAFYKDKVVGVIGGGNAALQSAAFLSGSCKKVYLIHRRDKFRGDEKDVEALKNKGNVEFVLNSRPVEFIGGETLEGAVIENTLTGEKSELKLDGAFVAVGQIPENKEFGGVVALDSDGYLDAGETTVTSSAGIFAAGDCRKKTVRQLTTAAADGASAALAACRYIESL